MTLSQKTLDFVAKQDAALNKQAGYAANTIAEIVDGLIRTGRVEVGWRESCGTTDPTHHVYRAWLKVLPKLKADGIEIAEEQVKHKNGSPTRAHGFWNSIIYTVSGGAR